MTDQRTDTPLDAVLSSPTRKPGGLHAKVVRLADFGWLVSDTLVGERAPWHRLRHPTAVGWVITRAFMVLLLFPIEQTNLNDVRYYAGNILEIGSATPIAAVLREYPTPVTGLLALPDLLARASVQLYIAAFIIMMLIVDGTFTWLLRRRSHDGPGAAVTLWLIGGVALGPVAITRFDLVPGVLAGGAVLVVASRPRLAGAAVALGAAIKLWPAILVPALAAPLRGRARVLTAAAVTGAIVLAASLAFGGWDRLMSPLDYQTDRGLQVESLPALPAMLAWSAVHLPWDIVFTKYIALEVTGPGVGLLVKLATVVTALALAFVAVLWWRAWRRGASVTAADIGWLMLTITALFIVTNKVFSPQYLLWLSPVAVATIACSPRIDLLRIRRWTVLLVGVELLTHVIYPNLYLLISGDAPNSLVGLPLLENSLVLLPHFAVTGEFPGNLAGVGILLLRDACLIGLTWYAARLTWRRTSSRPQ